MAISFVGSTTSNSLPAGFAAGDLLLYAVQSNGSESTPAGWSLVAVVVETHNTYLFSRVAAGGDSAPAALGTSQAVLAYRGVDTTTPIRTSGTASAAFANIAEATVTGALAGDWLIYVGGLSTPGTATAPAGTTERVDLSASFRALTAGDSAGDVAAGDYTLGPTWDAFNATRTIVAVLAQAAAAAEEMPAPWIDEPRPVRFPIELYAWQQAPIPANVTPGAPTPSSVVSFEEPPRPRWHDYFGWASFLSEESATPEIAADLAGAQDAQQLAASATTAISATLQASQGTQGATLGASTAVGATLAGAQAAQEAAQAGTTTTGAALAGAQGSQQAPQAAGVAIGGALAAAQGAQGLEAAASGTVVRTGALQGDQGAQGGAAAATTAISASLSVAQGRQGAGASAGVAVGAALQGSQGRQAAPGAASAAVGGLLQGTQAPQRAALAGGVAVGVALAGDQGAQGGAGAAQATVGGQLAGLQAAQGLGLSAGAVPSYERIALVDEVERVRLAAEASRVAPAGEWAHARLAAERARLALGQEASRVRMR